MKKNIFSTIFLCLFSLTAFGQLEIEGSINYDFSQINIQSEDVFLLGIPNPSDWYNSYGISLSVYKMISPKTSLGFGISAYQKKEIQISEQSFAINPRNKFLFKDIRLNFGLKQKILNNFYCKFNVSLQSLHKPEIAFLFSESTNAIAERKVFLGPEVRLGYTYKNIFIEILGFYSMEYFSDPTPTHGQLITLDVNGVDKTFSFGFNVGYKLNHPSKKNIEKKIQERFR